MRKNYNREQAKKLLKMNEEEARIAINLMRKYNGEAATDAVVAEINNVMEEVK